MKYPEKLNFDLILSPEKQKLLAKTDKLVQINLTLKLEMKESELK